MRLLLAVLVAGTVGCGGTEPESRVPALGVYSYSSPSVYLSTGTVNVIFASGDSLAADFNLSGAAGALSGRGALGRFDGDAYTLAATLQAPAIGFASALYIFRIKRSGSTMTCQVEVSGDVTTRAPCTLTR